MKVLEKIENEPRGQNWQQIDKLDINRQNKTKDKIGNKNKKKMEKIGENWEKGKEKKSRKKSKKKMGKK